MANNCISQKKQGQHNRRKGKRTRQNMRTYNNVQRRRRKHAASHGMKLEDIGAVRWVSVPTSKG